MSNGALYQTVSGNFNGVTSGNRVYGAAIQCDPLWGGQPEFTARGTVGAEVEATAATASLTITAVWQVQKGDGTWIDVAHGPSNPAGVAITTGTAAKKTVAIEAPRNIAGYNQFRLALQVGAATGGASDLYKISYTGAAFTGY